MLKTAGVSELSEISLLTGDQPHSRIPHMPTLRQRILYLSFLNYSHFDKWGVFSPIMDKILILKTGWTLQDSNLRPSGYEPPALPTELKVQNDRP